MTRSPGGAFTPDGRKVLGTSHWVSAGHALDAEVRLYDHLFQTPDPAEAPEGGDFKDQPQSRFAANAQGMQGGTEPGPGQAGRIFQFLRLGYFCVDPDSGPTGLIFNRTVTLRDSWAKIEKSRPEV